MIPLFPKPKGSSFDSLEPIRQAISEFSRFRSPGDRYLVGVSGGKDSVVLLHLLLEAGFEDLVICHLNHGLRGRAAGHDAAFVRRLAEKHGLTAEIGKADVSHLSEQAGISLEEAGRRARHVHFAHCANRRNCTEVILGHHADDQVETILINLGRGTSGLRGMQTESEIVVGGPSSGQAKGIQLRILRPLLEIWRSEIDEFAESEKIKFREDASNTDPAFLRNRVRHELIPSLNEIFDRDVRAALLRGTTVAADEDVFLTESAREAFREANSESPISGLSESTRSLQPTLKLSQLRKHPKAIQRRILHMWLTELRIPDCGFREVEALRELASTAPGIAKINLPQGFHARRKSGRLFVTPPGLTMK